MQMMLTRSLVSESVDELGVGMEVEDDWLISGKYGLPPLIR